LNLKIPITFITKRLCVIQIYWYSLRYYWSCAHMLLPSGHPTFLRLAGLNLKGFNQNLSDKLQDNPGS
jgi:hypothetical protein